MLGRDRFSALSRALITMSVSILVLTSYPTIFRFQRSITTAMVVTYCNCLKVGYISGPDLVKISRCKLSVKTQKFSNFPEKEAFQALGKCIILLPT
jgi:hypothetical protein